MMTLEELKEHLVSLGDDIFLLDVLDLTTEELVEALSDHIEEKYEKVLEEYDLIGEVDEE